QAIHRCSVDVAHGLVLLFGIGTRALPSWDPRTRRNNLLGGLAVSRTAGSSDQANSPHPSSREGHLSTAGWSSSFLLSDLILQGCHAVAVAFFRVARNSVPSTQMRRKIIANHPDGVHYPTQPPPQRDDRLFHPAAPSDLHRPGLEPGPFLRTHHGLSCFVEHRPHHLISTARYSAVPIDLARLILGARQPKPRPDGLGFAEASRNVDGSPIGQRHHGANAGG